MEGKIFGELVGDHSIFGRTERGPLPHIEDGYYETQYHYSPSHAFSFVIGTYEMKKTTVMYMGFPINYVSPVSNGLIKSIKRIP